MRVLQKTTDIWTNAKELDSDYNGTDITLDKRMSNGWMMTGGISIGKTVGDIYGTSDLNNPNFLFRRGIIGNDTPFSLRLSGIYDLPFGQAGPTSIREDFRK